MCTVRYVLFFFVFPLFYHTGVLLVHLPVITVQKKQGCAQSKRAAGWETLKKGQIKKKRRCKLCVHNKRSAKSCSTHATTRHGFNPVFLMCTGLLQGQHLCNGSCSVPVEEKRCGKRAPVRVSVPLHPEHEPRPIIQHLLHGRWACFIVISLLPLLSSCQAFVCLCVRACVLLFKDCIIMEHINLRSDASIYIPQVLWNWRLGTTWSFWSPVPQQTCPWVEIPPFWVLSSWLNVQTPHTGPEGRHRSQKSARGGGKAAAYQISWWPCLTWCCDKNTGSSHFITSWLADCVTSTVACRAWADAKETKGLGRSLSSLLCPFLIFIETVRMQACFLQIVTHGKVQILMT